MKKIKVSWSILSQWSSGNKDAAIKMLMGEEIEATLAMEEGKRIHEIISSKRLMLLPFLSEEAVFEKINPEKKDWINYFRVPVNEWLDLSLVIDVLDMKSGLGGLVVDWKTGRKKSQEHNKMQVYMYAYALSKLPKPLKVDHGVIAKVFEDESGAIIVQDWSPYKITPEKLELAENYIESNASEIYESLGFDKQN